MIHHDNTPLFENFEPSTMRELDYGLLLKEQLELENQKSTISTPHTVAHYTSPQENNVSFTKEGVADIMKSFEMDIIPVCGDELAEIEDVEDLGLIFEHQAEVDTDEFKKLVDEMKLCLHQLGWNYDGYVGEADEPHTVH